VKPEFDTANEWTQRQTQGSCPNWNNGAITQTCEMCALHNTANNYVYFNGCIVVVIVASLIDLI
jgi:hypothetical protein